MSILLSKKEISDVLGSQGDWVQDILAVAEAQAIHAVQYLEAPCTEHPFNLFGSGNLVRFIEHRYLCPDCMKQIKGELGI